MTPVEEPEQPHLRLYTIDDDALATARPLLTPEDFALADVTDDEWDAFHQALTDA